MMNQDQNQNDMRGQMRRIDNAAQEKLFTELAAMAAPGETIKIEVWDGMRTVDRLFSTAPIIDAPTDFADKVMAILAAQDFGAPTDNSASSKSGSPRRRRFLGRLLSVAILLPLACGLLIFSRNPAALALIMHQAIVWFNTAGRNIAALSGMLLRYTPSTLLAPAMLMTAALIVGVWLWLMSYTSTRRQQPVYRIPVRFH